MDSIPDSDFLTERQKEKARKETNAEFIKAYNARSFNYPKARARKSAKDIQAFAEDKLVAKSFTEMRCDLPGAPRSTFLMVFSPDGTKVASTHGNHNIYISDVRTGKNVKTLMGHPRTPWCIAFHPTSNQIVASGCLGGQVRIWDLSGGSEVWSSENSTVIASLTFHPEDRLLVIATYNQLHFWDWSKPKPFASVSTATTKEKVRYVAFDPLGHKLITGISNNTTPQSRWERSQRCPASSIHITPRHGDYSSPITSPNPPSRHAHPTSSPPDAPRYLQSLTRRTATSSSSGIPPSVFNNIAADPVRSQRARLTSRIIAHYRAFPPRTQSDALLFRNMFGETALAMSFSRFLSQQQQQSAGSAGGNNWDASSVRAEAGSEVDSLPDDDRPAIYSTHVIDSARNTNTTSRSPMSTQPSIEQQIGDLLSLNRTLSSFSSSRRDTTASRLSRRDWQSLRARNSNTAIGEDQGASIAQQPLVESSRPPPSPSLIGRREPLSSVPDRERRISACYRNLVREYEQLVHRYLQIYRPPVMIDRGTDPMDPAYPTTRHSTSLNQQQSTSTIRSSHQSIHRTIINNPANIQPLSSSSSHNPTDMRSVCEFTTTDPSVLSPLRNYEMEAARRNGGEYNKIGLHRRQLNVDQNSPRLRTPFVVDPIPSTSGAVNQQISADSPNGIGLCNAKITLVLKSVEQALKGFEPSEVNDVPSTSESHPEVTTSQPQNTNTGAEVVNHTNSTKKTIVQESVASISTAVEDNQTASTENNLQSCNSSETNQQVPGCDNNSNQQDEVNDLITNLTIITSMAVQLKSFSERLTLHKDNEEKTTATPENSTENDQEIAGPSNLTAKEDSSAASAVTIEAPSTSDSVSVENAVPANSETPNVTADIKLAKKMVEKIVEIMNTFSSQTSNNTSPSSTSNQSNQPSTFNMMNQPSTSNQSDQLSIPNLTNQPSDISAASNRKRPYNLFKNKSNRKPILVDSSSDESSDNEQIKSRKMRKRIYKKSREERCELNKQTDKPGPIIISSSSDEAQEQEIVSAESNNVSINDNASDATSASMYNNVASDDIARTSDFTERRPWNYNRELEQLVTDLLHDNNNDATPNESVPSETTSLLCSACGDSLGTCTPNLCRNNHSLESAGTSTPNERRRRFFCHRLSAFHPTRVQTRFRNQRLRQSHASTLGRRTDNAAPSDTSYFQQLNLLPQQDTALDEVINFSQRSAESEPVETQPPATFDPSYPTYHPFDPPPELDTINPEHIGIGNMYSNIVQELETSLNDIRNIRSQRRLGETSDMLSNFSERLESIMTQSHAILRNLSTSIDTAPNDPNGNYSSGTPGRNNNPRGGSAAASNSNSWVTAQSRDAIVPLGTSSPINNLNRSLAANPQSVNADHNYPRPTSNMSPLMASLHLTVSHIWRQARLLRSQMDSIERIDRAMLELAQLRVMRQMFADLSLYFCISDHNIRGSNHLQDTGRRNRASNALERNTSRTGEQGQNGTNSTGTATVADQTTVNSMRRMMAGTRISDNDISTTSSPSGNHQHRSSATTLSRSSHTRSKLYPCVLVMHPREHSNRRHATSTSGVPGGSGVRLRGCAGSRVPRQLTRRSLYRQMGGMGMGGMSMVDVAAPGRARNYMNLLNPDTFPALSHRLEHYLIEHGRLLGRHPANNNNNHINQPSTSNSPNPIAQTTNTSSVSAERVLTVRLNNCRMRMHRLLGGRSQYGTNANTGPQSLVTRDGASRYNARHTLCIMLDTLSRFMEVYGTGLVGISGSFRTYLREVIDLSRLLSEVLLLQIVDAIPPPTGMMLDPERENLAQRIDDMCSRMILTRLSSQSQPLTRCLRLMRLNVRFFSHAISQNRLLEARFTSRNVNNSQELRNLDQSDTREEHSQGARRTHYSVMNTLNEVRRRQRENREMTSTTAPTRGNDQPRSATPPPFTEPPQQQERQPQIQEQRQQQFTSAPSAVTWRLDNRFAVRPPPPSLDEWRTRDMFGGSGPTTNMSELLYQRLGLDIAEDLPQPRVLVPRVEITAANQHVRANLATGLQNTSTFPAATSSFSTLLAGPQQQPSAAATENQRFLDSLTNTSTALTSSTTSLSSSAAAAAAPPPPPPPVLAPARTAIVPQPSSLTLNDPNTSGISRETRVQQLQLQLQQQRRLYVRSSSYESSGRNNNDNTPSRHSREVIAPESVDAVEGRGGQQYPMYYSPIQWSLPEVQLNNVPIMRDNQDNLYVQPGRSTNATHQQHRFQLNRDLLLDEPVFLHQRGVPPAAAAPRALHAHGPPLFSRPRFLHPLYAWSSHAQINGQMGGMIDGVDEDRPYESRVSGEQLYETDIIAAVTPNHRIQVWEFNKMGEGHAIIPHITNALKNVVVSECKIHNDASVDIATDGSVLVTLLPSNSYLNITNRLGIYSLEWETLGQILYITTFDQNAVSVSLSPLSRHLVVGLASRRVTIMPSEQWTLARIFLLDGRRMAFGRLSLMKEIEQSRETNFVMSVNCIRWLPTSGQGLVFATNTGQLRILN